MTQNILTVYEAAVDELPQLTLLVCLLSPHRLGQ